jgi:hypothetical protein
MKNFPKINGMTFTGAYSDDACTEPITANIASLFDYDNVACLNPSVDIYTTWREGTWYKITTAEQLSQNASKNGCYEILADLDFQGKVWPAFKDFGGKIIGNGHKISNITVVQTDTKPMNVGLFEIIKETAVFENVSFENVSFTIKGSMNNNGTNYGLLAGTSESGASFTGVSISGSLIIDENMFDSYLFGFYPNHSIHKLVGNGTANGVSESITAILDPDVSNAEMSVMPDGTIELSAGGGQNG